MADPGVVYSEKTLKKVEGQITKVYSEAQKDIQQKLDDHLARYQQKNSEMVNKLASGKITATEYSDWASRQYFQTKLWEQKRDQITDVLANANKHALQIVNGGTIDVFAENCNYESFAIEQGFGTNFGFGLVDSNTMTKLIKEQPKLLPLKTLDVSKDKAWNQKKITNCITQGILQGESIDKIADRIAKVTSSQNRNSMVTNARTAVTGAQNMGREQMMKHAAELGINIEKEWMATLDNRTRTSHAHLDGEKIKVGDKWHHYTFSNGCRFPGDPQGPGWEVYNCRCTLVTNFLDYPDDYERRDNINGKVIKNMTYDEWKAEKMKAEAKASIEDMALPIKKFKTIKAVVKKKEEGPAPRTATYIDGLTENNFNSMKRTIDRHINRFASYEGLEYDEALEGVNGGLKKILDNSDFTMRIKAENLEKVLDDGYFKNQFETRSSGGCFNPEMRRRLENDKFNVPKDDSILDADRPVYGMFCPKFDINNPNVIEYYTDGPGSWYGDGVTVVLDKNKVVNNATMTIGDSLDYDWTLSGTEVNNPCYTGSFDEDVVDYLYQTDYWDDPDEIKQQMMDIADDGDHYFEYQLHGKETHSAGNIEKVYFNVGLVRHNTRIKSLLDKLNSRGIPWEVIGQDQQEIVDITNKLKAL